ncbi:MAG TPA: hypothetical protein VNW90_09840 [Acetobacteraceae bacterium]|jgi:hypothetical protein|nr:hypothetical protein [Acetobacteraceae bacterium]
MGTPTQADTQTKKKRQSGIPAGNAGEYFVMGELLRRGFDAQLAGRNTKGYDLLVGRPGGTAPLRQVQVKTVREGSGNWFVNVVDFESELLNGATVYVHLGKLDGKSPVRLFIAKNRDVKIHIQSPNWKKPGVKQGFMPRTAVMVEQYENKWCSLLTA